ncbi:phosphate propanoyltransferase [archaeon]|jgi:putative phosphotransacetylase|nr:phosphate propanoyltransferase [archaeon]MBT4241337.1 phosphate propanoyltransferase [archaeon]MBT4418158.1 phosphate propanoyltransferase [archaeon]
MGEKIQVKVEASNRHVHLSRHDADVLFGEGYEFGVHKELSQPGQFSAQDRITLVCEDRKIENVRVLGPFRDESQVEISRTDAFNLKLNVPLKHSGDLEGSPGITLVGPKGRVKLDRGVIISHRHLHASEDEAGRLGLKHGDLVNLRVPSIKEIIFNNVMVRVSSDYKLAFHIDFDDANACFFEEGILAELV